ncbi:MAG: hypothetical protein AABY05_00660 [Nanoarchaeota archaeon]
MKKGIGHIEFILSFILFFSAIGFALYFFNPSNTDRLVDVSLTYLFNEVEKNTTLQIRTFSLKINSTKILNENGQNYAGAIFVNLPEIDLNLKPRVEDINGLKFNSKRSGDFFYISPFQSNWNNVEFIYLKLSEDFVEDEVNPPNSESIYYAVASSVSKKVTSEKRFKNLKESYDLDYDGLKDRLNMPKRADFSFALIFEDSKIEVEKEIPTGFEVFSDSKRVEVIREDGSTSFAELNLKVW